MAKPRSDGARKYNSAQGETLANNNPVVTETFIRTEKVQMAIDF